MSYRDELDAWRRTREATKRIMADLDRDELGYLKDLSPSLDEGGSVLDGMDAKERLRDD